MSNQFIRMIFKFNIGKAFAFDLQRIGLRLKIEVHRFQLYSKVDHLIIAKIDTFIRYYSSAHFI